MDTKKCGGNVHGMGSGTEYIYIYINDKNMHGFNHSSHTAAVEVVNEQRLQPQQSHRRSLR